MERGLFCGPEYVLFLEMFHVPWKKLVFFAVVGCSALQISISSNDSVFQIFYVLTDFLSTCSSDYWEYYWNLWLVIVDLSLSPSSFISFCFMYFDAIIRCMNIYNCYFLMMNWPLYYYEMIFFISVIFFALKPTL